MIRIQRLHPQARLPTRGTPQSVGLDLYALLLNISGRPDKALLAPRSSRLIPTGIIIAPPDGFFFLIHSRSGLATKNIFCTTGTIDPDYRGEIKVLLYNGGWESYYVQHEDRIAQLVLHPLTQFFNESGKEWDGVIEVEKIDITPRGSSGFGSTGR